MGEIAESALIVPLKFPLTNYKIKKPAKKAGFKTNNIYLTKESLSNGASKPECQDPDV